MSTTVAPTTPQLSPTTEAVTNPDPLSPQTTGAPSDAPAMSYTLTLANLTVSVTSTNLSLAWSAPDEAFDSFVLEVRGASGGTQVHVSTVPGHVREAEIEGLSPSTQYEITLQGLLEGNNSLPLKVLATTGTWSNYLFLQAFIITLHSHTLTG